MINGDITPPVITGCDQNFEFFSFPSDIDSFPFFWDEPTATDNDGEPPVVSRSLVPGSVIGFGVPQYVHYNFTDTSGNIAFCWFRILFDCEYISFSFLVCMVNLIVKWCIHDNM